MNKIKTMISFCAYITYILLANFYIQAQNTVISKIEALQPLSLCDQQYIRSMTSTLNTLASTANQNILQTAQDYMIMVKQHIDLELKFRALENTVFDTATIAELRKPLADYTRCRNNILLRPTAAPSSGTTAETTVTKTIAPLVTPANQATSSATSTSGVVTVVAAPAA